MRKTIGYLLLLVTVLNGCTRDDICPEDSPTTPLLIITFKDFTNPEISKTVTNLTIKTTEETPVTLLYRSTTDSIAIPLNTNTELTKLFFINNDNDDDTGNFDTLTFTYQTEEIYLNRACGFIANYTNLQADLQAENNTNWIQDITILQTSITDETNAHITILH